MPRRSSATSFGGKSGNKKGRGPAKGAPNAGALPATFKNRMALLAARAKTAKNIESILDDPKHPQFMKALEFAADRGYGRVEQPQTHTGSVEIIVRRDEPTLI